MSKRGPPGVNDPPQSPKKPRQTILSNTLTPILPTLPPDTTVSAPIEDRGSKFIGYFIPTTTLSALARHKSLFQSLPALADANHKIMAWNVGRSTGFDDDGEKLAGRKILEILVSNEDQGLICVARWYGGILLGPVRFEHIVHVAADALATYRLSQRMIPAIANPTVPVAKKVDNEERERLMRVLKGKDMNIESLRAMINAKKVERGEAISAPTSPVKEKQYDKMQVDGLKRLVIARDATIKSLRDIMQELNENQVSTGSG